MSAAEAKARAAERKRRHRKKRPEIYKNRDLLRHYGISLCQYQAILKKQKSGCAICRGQSKTGKLLSVDHCHKTGRVRGLLCNCCNLGLGKFKDDRKLIKIALSYLTNAPKT